MKYKEPIHWKFSEDLDGLLYFSQVLNELLFDYTIDTYKPNALNAHSIVHETLTLLRKVKSKHIHKANLKPVKEELINFLSKDLACKALLGDKRSSYKELIKNTSDLDELYHTIFSLHTYLAEKTYFEKVKELLIEKVSIGKEKSDIFSLTRTLVTELITYGYSKEYLYNQTNTFFFQERNDKVDSVDFIKLFLDQFNFEKEKFEVFIQAPPVFWDFRKPLGEVDIKLSKTIKHTEKNRIFKRFVSKNKTSQTYIIIKEVESLDHFSARKTGERKLHFFVNLFHLYFNRESLEVSNLSCVNRVSDNYTLIIDEPINNLRKQKDYNSKEASKKVETLIKNLSFSSKNSSIERFIKAIELHKLALNTPDEENQLLDLWAAIETIFEKKTDNEESTIEQVSREITPFISSRYIEGLMVELFKDLCIWNKLEFFNLLDKINTAPSKRLESFVSLLVLEEYDSLHDDLLDLLGLFPLLRNRATLYNKWFKDPKEVKKFIERHTTKISWQIKRIYRARNTLIHHGSKPKQLPILVENLNNYFHKVMSELEVLMINEKIRSIEHGIIESGISYSEHLKFIGTIETIDNENLPIMFKF